MGVMGRYYNDSLKRQSCLMDVFVASAIPMFAKKASQPSSIKNSNCLLLARLLSTRGHPLTPCIEVNKNQQNVSIAESGW